jgi:hypothetical protein
VLLVLTLLAFAPACGGEEEAPERAVAEPTPAGLGEPVVADGWRVTLTRARAARSLKLKDTGIRFGPVQVCTAGVCEDVPLPPGEEIVGGTVSPPARRTFVLVRLRFQNMRPAEKRGISLRDVVLIGSDGRRLKATGLAEGQYGPPGFAGCTDCKPTVSTTAKVVAVEFAFTVKKAIARKRFEVRFRKAREIAFALPAGAKP